MSRYNIKRRGTNRIYVDRRGRGSRIQTVIIFSLLAVLIGLTVYSVPALRFRYEEAGLVRTRLLADCEAAVTRVQRLSRTAGSNSSVTMAEIRSYIYAMDVLNQMHASLTGETLVDGALFTNLYSLMESYSAQLLTGTDTGAMQTAIDSAVSEIYTRVQALN